MVSPTPDSLGKPFPKISHLSPSQAEQLQKLPPLDMLTIALVCIFSSNLTHS